MPGQHHLNDRAIQQLARLSTLAQEDQVLEPAGVNQEVSRIAFNQLPSMRNALALRSGVEVPFNIRGLLLLAIDRICDVTGSPLV